MYLSSYNILHLDLLKNVYLDDYRIFFSRQSHHHTLVGLLIHHLPNRNFLGLNFHRYKSIPINCKYYGYQIHYSNRTFLVKECGIEHWASDSLFSLIH